MLIIPKVSDVLSVQEVVCYTLVSAYTKKLNKTRDRSKLIRNSKTCSCLVGESHAILKYV